ncbi:hypothetical protein DERP_012244 [Dermatophagoides pteronyssinus]|uniref:Uncharacterized protein n=1 Tax=Dermatophagoides pteronyssinus TaxID=6956 RepID=A0ABQ8JGF8_DERPT|nr:hypothetical protein DERP_012244 [Dermatophagoides pteronyssinus]
MIGHFKLLHKDGHWTTKLVKVGDFDRQDELWKPIQFRTRNMNWNQIIVEILTQTNTLPET